MPAKNLTSRFVESVKVTERTDYQDQLVRGLWMRVSPAGLKTWAFRYRRESDGAKQRLALGRFPVMSLEKARNEALKVAGRLAEGDDPSEAKRVRRAAMTVQELGALFIERYSKPHKRTWDQDERTLRADVYPIVGHLKITAVKRRDILDVVQAKADTGAMVQSRHVLAILRQLFSWAVQEAFLETSPARDIKQRGKMTSRERVLTADEMRTVWNALPDAGMLEQTREVFRLLFLTGQRSGEVCGMRRSEINLENALWTIPGNRAKNGLTHIVPLSPAALNLVERALRKASNEPGAPLFSRTGEPMESHALSRAARRCLQFFDDPWTPHDIRRTVATGMAGLGIAPHVIEATLNHISGFRAGVSGVYNRHRYDAEKRRALDIWAEHLDALVTGRKSVVLPMTRGGA